ncbi:MAG: hypothetical protein RR068_05065 [Hafnia sp.]
MIARTSLWSALLAALVLGVSTASCAADTSSLDITGTLIKPPCSADLTLVFKCVKGSLVQLRFSAGSGSFDSSTLRTSLDKLGLKTRLSDLTTTEKVVDLKLGEQLVFPVEDMLLKLKLSVRPIKTGQELPEIGNYSSMLLMEMIYL